ncbi:MAG: S8 family peptidase, partial [Acidobacteria bacterium]
MKKLCLALTALLVLASAAHAGDGTIIPAKGKPIKNSYIVVFTPGAASGDGVASMAQQMANLHGGKVKHVYKHALYGAAFEMNAQQAQGLARNPNVLLVEEDGELTVNSPGSQSGATWGIDRVDQRNLPLNSTYNWDFMGSGVNIYIVDTGIRTTHSDFGGRASWGTDCTGEGQSDGHGHGTHVAGTAGSATYGVAKGANLIAVKVCNSGGSCPNSAVLCGIDFVTQQKLANPSIPMVANMSLGGGFSSTENDAVNNSVATGVFYAVAAGNDNANACNFSPASAADAYTVGSTTSSDARSSFSNFGTCVDIFAPGSSITSTWNTSNTATNTISGTSMASPHVAGAAALVFEENPTWTPFQVMTELTNRATSGVLTGIGTGSPNLLLHTLGAAPPP